MRLLKQVWPHEGSALIAVITELALEVVCDVVVALDVLVIDEAVLLLLLVATTEDVAVEELVLEAVATVLQFPH